MIPCFSCADRNITRELEDQGLSHTAEKIDQIRNGTLKEKKDNTFIMEQLSAKTGNLANILSETNPPLQLEQTLAILRLSSRNTEPNDVSIENNFRDTAHSILTPAQRMKVKEAVKKTWANPEERALSAYKFLEEPWVKHALTADLEHSEKADRKLGKFLKKFTLRVQSTNTLPEISPDLFYSNIVLDLITDEERSARFLLAYTIQHWSLPHTKNRWIDSFIKTRGAGLTEPQRIKYREFILSAPNPKTDVELKALEENAYKHAVGGQVVADETFRKNIVDGWSNLEIRNRWINLTFERVLVPLIPKEAIETSKARFTQLINSARAPATISDLDTLTTNSLSKVARIFA
jgi:hypothetical protein